MAEASDEHAASVEEKMGHTIHEFFAVNEKAMVVKWMLQAEIIDNDGEQAMWTLESPGMALWDMMGVMLYMQTHLSQKIQAARSCRCQDDDDD